HLGPTRDRGVVQGIGDLPVALSRVVEDPGSLWPEPRNCGRHLAGELRERAGADPAARLSGGQLARRTAPDLARVRKVEIAADRSAQACLQHVGEGRVFAVADSPAPQLDQGVSTDTGQKVGRDPEGQVYGLQWEVDPPPAQPDTPVTGPGL